MTGSNNGNGNGNGNGSTRVGTSTVKQGLAQMLKGGVIVSAVLLDPCPICTAFSLCPSILLI